MSERSRPFQERPNLGIALIAVLRSPQVSSISGSVLQKGYKVGWTNDVYRATNFLRISRCRYERHVSTIADAGHHYTICIQIGLRFDPIQERPDIVVGIFSHESI